MSELVVLDPLEEAPSRFEVDITAFIGGAGPDWGDAAIEAYMAEAALGQVPADYRLPNRVITIPLNLLERDGRSFEEIRATMQAKAALFQREGGLIKREINGVPWYADVVGATLRMGGSTAQALYEVDPDAVLTLETLPDWYGEEVELDLDTATGAGEIVAVLPQIAGDHPGRVRLVVRDLDNVPRRGLLWAFRARHRSDAPTAAVAYAAEDLTPADTASLETVAGSYGSQAVVHPGVGANWTPVLLTDVVGEGSMTHTGSYRVWARVRADSGDVRTRLVWDVGDLVDAVPNPARAVPGPDAWYDIDFGAIRLDPAPFGTHRWKGMFQAISADGAQTFAIDRVWLQNVDESAGTIAVTSPTLEPGVREYAARDEFSQPPGTLYTAPAPVGGIWVTGGDGTTEDFELDGERALRDAADDGSAIRFARLGPVMTASVAQVDISFDGTSDSNDFAGLALRFTGDVYHQVIAQCDNGAATGYFTLSTGEGASLGLKVIRPQPFVWYTIRLAVYADGVAVAWMFPKGGSPGKPITAVIPEAATGGDLESGCAAIMDLGQDEIVRRYDNFAAWELDRDAVIHPNQSIQIRTEGVFRESEDGDGCGPITPRGDLPRLPPSGLEGRECEVLVKTTRGDLDQLPDTTADDLEMEVHYRPSWLFVPEQAPGS